MSDDQTIVHVLRHGEVHNPGGLLYGRLPGFHLSDLGRAMAQRVADTVGDRDIVHMRVSPMERVQETAAPLATVRGLEPVVDHRLIESTNVFEGQRFGPGATTLSSPKSWVHLWNPLRPSWGEPYKQVAARMRSAVIDARDNARGHEALVVSHQLPIWVLRLAAEGRPFLHDPRKRQCTLCSLTSLRFEGSRLVQVSYSEPAGDMIPTADKAATFSSGGSSEES